MQEVTLPDGSIVEFPETMTPEAMKAAIKKHMPNAFKTSQKADKAAIERDAELWQGGVLSGDIFPTVGMAGSVMETPEMKSRKEQKMANIALQMVPFGGTFAGVTAKTANKVALGKAKEMAKKGAKREEIWRETGWFKDVDGHWKFEIDDSVAQYSPQKEFDKQVLAHSDEMAYANDAGIIRAKMDKGMTPEEAIEDFTREMKRPPHPYAAKGAPRRTPFQWKNKQQVLEMYPVKRDKMRATAGDIFDHPELYQAHPDTQNMPWSTRDAATMGNSFGFYRTPRGQGDLGEIAQSTGAFIPEKGKSGFLHEMQHAIQERELFGGGGNLSIAQKVKWLSLHDKYKKLGGDALVEEGNEVARKLSSLSQMKMMIDFNAITQPRRVFNSSLFYQYSDQLRSALGPIPRNSKGKKQWAEKAGKWISEKLWESFPESRVAEVKSLLRGGPVNKETVGKAVKSYEGKLQRLNKKGYSQARRLRGLMDAEDPVNYPYQSFDEQYEAYRRISGEAEARNVQTRMNMTAQERKAKPPWETLDVPEDEIFVRKPEYNKYLLRKP